MKKRVTFAQRRTVHRLRQDEALPRFNGATGSKTASDHVTFNNSMNVHTRPSDRCERAQIIPIPHSLSAAPFLQYSVLSPAQKDYLYTVAATYSPVLVRNIIHQHYMNVLHRCIRAGHAPENYVVLTPVNQPQIKAEVSSKATNKEKKNSRKTVLPKIHKRQPRFIKASASKHGRKPTTSPKMKRKNPKPVTVKLDEDEDEDDDDIDIDAEFNNDDDDDDDDGQKRDDSLSDCLSSLSLTDWDEDDDSLSDV